MEYNCVDTFDFCKDFRESESKEIFSLSTKLSSSKFDSLIEGTYKPEDFDEYYKQGRAWIINKGSIMVTEECNLRCTYCFLHNKGPRTIDFDTAKEFIDIILGIKRDDKYGRFGLASPFTLHIMGGETMLYAKLVYDIIEYFDSQINEYNIPISFKIQLPTNGTLLRKNSEYISKLVNKYRDRFGIYISIDCNKEAHDACRIYPNGEGSYDDSMDGYNLLSEVRGNSNFTTKNTLSLDSIKYLSDAVIDDYINNGKSYFFSNWVQETKYSFNDAEEYYYQCKYVIDYMISSGAYKKFKFAPLSRNLDTYLKEYENRYVCTGAGSEIAIAPNRKFYPCTRYISQKDNILGEDLSLGSLEKGYVNSEEDIKHKERSLVKRSDCSTYKCYNCPCATVNCIACPAFVYEICGNDKCRTTFDCNMNIAETLVRTYGMNKIYRELEKENSLYFFITYRLMVPKDLAIPIIGEDEYNMISELSRERM